MLNPIEEQKYKDLRDQCKELGVLTAPDVFIGLKVNDLNGVLVFDDVQRGHSWTRNYYNMMFCAGADCSPSGTTYAAGALTAKRYSGTIDYAAGYTLSKATSGGFIGSVADGNGAGILVGTGDTAFALTDYALVTKIVSGNSANQLYYQAQGNSTITYDSSSGAEKWTAVHSRVFNNNSGGSITVKETGLVWYGGCWVNNSGITYLLERSVLDPTVAVANGAQLTVTYTIVGDFSAID